MQLERLNKYLKEFCKFQLDKLQNELVYKQEFGQLKQIKRDYLLKFLKSKILLLNKKMLQNLQRKKQK